MSTMDSVSLVALSCVFPRSAELVLTVPLTSHALHISSEKTLEM